MNNITSEGKALLSRLNQGKFIFTRALLDTTRSLSIIGSTSFENLFTLKLRIDNLNLTESISYTQIIVYAKIEGDSSDVVYAVLDKSSYIPSSSSIPEFVEDIDLCFAFSDIDSITIDSSALVYALNKDLLAKPNLFVGTTKPSNLNSPYLWYQTFGDDIGFAGSDSDIYGEAVGSTGSGSCCGCGSNSDDSNTSSFNGEIILELSDYDSSAPLSVLIDNQLSSVDNATSDNPDSGLEFTLEL